MRYTIQDKKEMTEVLSKTVAQFPGVLNSKELAEYCFDNKVTPAMVGRLCKAAELPINKSNGSTVPLSIIIRIGDLLLSGVALKDIVIPGYTRNQFAGMMNKVYKLFPELRNER